MGYSAPSFAGVFYPMKSRKSTRHLGLVVLFTALLGCASDALNLDRYRDERATDIESRLTREESIVKSPFGQPEKKED